MAIGISTTFSYPFFSGGTTAVAADLVPRQYPVALGGHPYLLDTKNFGQFRHEGIPLLRSQQDIRDRVGEASLNPAGLWLRSSASWDHGAGQTYLDDEESDEFRFRSSKGINPWTRRELSLLQATLRKKTSANTNLQLAVAGDRLYVIDGTAIAFTTDVTAGSPTWTAVTGGPATAPVSVASDGNNILTAHGSDGVYRTTRTTGTTASWVTGTASLVGFGMDRVIVAAGPSLYNPTTAYTGGPAALPAAHFTHRNPDFTWVGITSGLTHFYVAGFSGDKSEVYKVRISDDGTTLGAPSRAHPGLPDGEVIRALDSYLGFILIGTDKGWRFAQPDASGNLSIGALVPTTSAVRCFEGQDKFIWYGITNYDGTSTGLGRMSPETVIGALAPAYASDLMATTQGAVLSVATFQSRRVFAVSGDGVWTEDTANLVSTGTLDTGYITYGISDPKVAMFLDTRYRVLVGSHQAFIAASDGVFQSLGTHSATTTTEQFSAGQLRSEVFELRHILNRDAANTNTGPVLIRSTLKVNPTTDMGEYLFVPVLLSDFDDLPGGKRSRDPRGELSYLKGLKKDRTLVIYQEGLTSYPVTVEDLTWYPHHDTRRAWNGTALLKMKALS